MANSLYSGLAPFAFDSYHASAPSFSPFSLPFHVGPMPDWASSPVPMAPVTARFSSPMDNALDFAVPQQATHLGGHVQRGSTFRPGFKLANPHGTTNVYINGLPRTCTDEQIRELCKTYGNIVSVKAIVDEDGQCKGYGFVKYSTTGEAKKCIVALGRSGYQTSFARESLSAKLAKLNDEETTNVYLSNLPWLMDEKALEDLFAPHEVVSLVILKNADGLSRGVGLARLKDRASAQECIDKLSGIRLPGAPAPLAVRFADSEAQKRMKAEVKASKGETSAPITSTAVVSPAPPTINAWTGQTAGAAGWQFLTPILRSYPEVGAYHYPMSMPNDRAATNAHFGVTSVVTPPKDGVLRIPFVGSPLSGSSGSTVMGGSAGSTGAVPAATPPNPGGVAMMGFNPYHTPPHQTGGFHFVQYTPSPPTPSPYPGHGTDGYGRDFGAGAQVRTTVKRSPLEAA